MKKFMNKSSLALLLTLLMLLSAITVGASLFAVSAEDDGPEATMTYGDVTKSGNLADLAAESLNFQNGTKATITLNKDVELQAPIAFKHGRVQVIEGNGHTIYFAPEMMTESLKYLVTFQNQNDNSNRIYFRNVNFSGQAMGWKKGVDEAVTFGKSGQAGGAFGLHSGEPITFENCRFENFYSMNQASVIYFIDNPVGNTWAGARYLELKDTVITNNYAMGNAVGNNASAIRTRNGDPKDATQATTYNANIHVSGNTYIYDNYDKNGNQANMAMLRAQGKAGNENADNRLHVKADFTGKVGLIDKDYLAKTAETKQNGVVINSCELPASVIFYGEGKGDLDSRVGKVVCVTTGSTSQATWYVIPSTTANADGNYPAEKIVQCYGIRYMLAGETEWTYHNDNNLFNALDVIKNKDLADETVVELLDDVIWYRGGQLSTSGFNFNVVLNGNGHTVNAISHGAGAPLMSLYAGTFTVNNTIFDGGVTVTNDGNGNLSFEGTTYAGGQGAFFRAFSSGAVATFNNVEIRNFVHAKAAGGNQAGAAMAAYNGGDVYMNDVYIHDNYSSDNAVLALGDNSHFYFNGKCVFENNYAMTSDKTVSPATYTLGVKMDAETNTSYKFNFAAGFETESLIFGPSRVAAGDVFATLTDGTLNENANLINFANPALIPIIKSDSTLKWGTAQEEITIVVNTKAGVKAFEYTTMLSAGEKLPEWNGVIWNGDATLKTHVAGTKTYTATWAADAATIALYKYYGDADYSISTSGNGLQNIIIGATGGTEASDNVIELIDNVVIPGKLQKSSADMHVTISGNGCVISDSSTYQAGGLPMFHLTGATTKVVFENVILDGGANVTVDPETGLLSYDHRYGGGHGAAIRTYEAGVELTLIDVEIRNFAQLRTGGSGTGAALYVYSGSTVMAHNLYVHDNYSAGGTPIVSAGSTSQLHLSGDCTFENNYYSPVASGDTYKISAKYDIQFNAATLYIASDFTTDSLVFNTNAVAGAQFAVLEEGATLNANAKFVNYSDTSLLVEADGSKLRWTMPGADAVTITVMGKDGTTEILSYEAKFYPGDALYAWNGAIWNGDAAIKSHVAGTTDYVVTWADDSTVVAFATTDNGDTWEVTDNLHNFTNYSKYTNIEVIGDLVLAATFNICDNAKYVLDFNGYTVTRSSLSVRIQIVSSTVKSEGYPEDKSPRNVIIKDAKFDGKINGVREQTQGNTEFVYFGYGSYGTTFDNCEFFDFWGTQGSVFRALQPSSFTLKDVYMHDNVATQGAIRAHTGSGTEFVRVYLAGNTRIYNDSSKSTDVEAKNIIYNAATFAIVDDFSGNVQATGGVPVSLGSKLATSSLLDWAYVAEGAVVTGTITNLTNSYVAAGVNGDLIWVQKGAELPGASFKVDENDKLKVYTSPWYYNDGEKDVRTTSVVEGFYNYFGGGDYVLDDTIEAYIADKIAGDLKTVAKAAANGDTIEIIKSVKVHGVSLGANVTVNGNNMTLTITPESEGGDEHMLLVTKNATINDLNFFGGATTAGKWEGPIAPQDKALLFANSVDSYVYLNNCTFTGHRVVTKNDHGSAIYNSSSKMFFTDCTIVDNFARSTPKDDDSRSLSTARPALRVMNEGCVSFYGKCVVKDNYGVWSDDSAVASKGIQIVSSERMYVGQLAEGSQIVLGSNYGYITGLDANGLPFNNSGYISVGDGNQSFELDADFTEPCTHTVVYIAGFAPASEQNAAYGAKNGEYGALTYPINPTQVGIEGTDATGGAQITADKLTLTVYVPVMAPFHNTNIVVKLGNKVVSTTPLSEFPATLTTNTRNTLAIPVVVGMAELTSGIEILLQDSNGSNIDAYTTSAKKYADTLIKMTDAELVELNVPQAKIVPLKSAMAALLQYGQTVQEFFDITGPAAMTNDDITLWETLGLTLNTVATSVLNTSLADESVLASASGTLPAGVTILGSTLTMENEISLRLYFTATNLEGLTFKVNGETVEAVTTKQGSYIEASHIGTQKLAVAAEFTISDGTTTYTYSASPMSYVYTVNEAEVGAVITEELKNACAALYYYYSAVAECFNLGFDTTGFLTVGTLRVLTDTVNSFSAPRFIVIA